MLSTAIFNQQQENLCAQNQQTLVVPRGRVACAAPAARHAPSARSEMKSFLKASLGLDHRKRKDAASKAAGGVARLRPPADPSDCASARVPPQTPQSRALL